MSCLYVLGNDTCTLLVLSIVFLSFTCLLCFYQSRARKPAKKTDDNKEEVYDEPDPVSEEQTLLWLIDVLCCLFIAAINKKVKLLSETDFHVTVLLSSLIQHMQSYCICMHYTMNIMYMYSFAQCFPLDYKVK